MLISGGYNRAAHAAAQYARRSQVRGHGVTNQGSQVTGHGSRVKEKLGTWETQRGTMKQDNQTVIRWLYGRTQTSYGTES